MTEDWTYFVKSWGIQIKKLKETRRIKKKTKTKTEITTSERSLQQKFRWVKIEYSKCHLDTYLANGY